MKYASIIVVLTLILGCQHVDRPEPPSDLISKDIMVEIMTEVYLGNAAKSVNNKVVRQSGLKLDSMIYKKFGVDSMQFVRSNAYYTSRLDDYAEIFEGVERRLTRLKEEHDSINIPKGRPKTDSIESGQLVEPAGGN